jgi:hypothetical protein
MSLKCGIVGLPNVGKSTVFNALTKAQIAAANYPFCTIEPNVGIVPVPDPRLEKLATIVSPKQIIPAVNGASKGEGLGNQFLANIRETNAIAHVVRCFENPDVIHVEGKVDPLSDIEVIDTELVLADLESVEKAISKVSKVAKSGDKEAKVELTFFEQLKNHLDQGKPARTLYAGEIPESIRNLHLLTAKKILYIANVDEKGFTDNPHLDKVKELAEKENAKVVAICAVLEAEIAQLLDEEKMEFLHEIGLDEPGLNRVIRAGYDLLGLETFFTAGPKEVRAWTVKRNTKAPQAAGVIHTDFERGFICAEVISFDDFIRYNGEAGARDAGKLRLEGKNYLVKDGDVMHFRFNV